MAIALVKSAKGTSALATTTASFASATTSGNLIVLGFASDDYNGSPGAGWTQSTGMEQQTFHGGYIWWRISTGETNFSYTIGSAANSAWVIAEFSGVHGTPYDISNGQFQATSTNSYTTPSITPTTGNRLLVAMMGGSHNSNLSTNTWGTWLNSFTGIDSIGSGGAGTNDCVGLAYRLVTGDGSTGYSSGATSSAVTFQAKSGLIISFKEAAGGAAYTLPAAKGAFALSGQAATLRSARKLIAAAGSFALSGNDAGLRYGYKIGASSGSFALSGVAANFKRTYALAAATGSFVLSGKNAGLAFGHKLTASSGSFALSGQSATLRRGYSITAGSAAFNLSGQAAALRVARKLVTGAGAFALTGIDANLFYAPIGTSYTLTASTGSFVLTGQSVGLSAAWKLVAASGSFALTGQAASLRSGRRIVADQSSFILTGNDADLIYVPPFTGYTLTADAGSFVLIGWDALLKKTRRSRSRYNGEYDDYGWSNRRPSPGKFGSKVF